MSTCSNAPTWCRSVGIFSMIFLSSSRLSINCRDTLQICNDCVKVSCNIHVKCPMRTQYNNAEHNNAEVQGETTVWLCVRYSRSFLMIRALYYFQFRTELQVTTCCLQVLPWSLAIITFVYLFPFPFPACVSNGSFPENRLIIMDINPENSNWRFKWVNYDWLEIYGALSFDTRSATNWDIKWDSLRGKA